MQPAIAAESQLIAQELYTFLNSIDPDAWRAELEAAARERLANISARLRAALEKTERAEEIDAGLVQLRERLATLARLVDEHRPRPDLSLTQLGEEWRAFCGRVQPGYEALATALRARQLHAPSLRPTNYKRSILHFCMGTSALLMVHHLLDRTGMIAVMAVLAGWMWSMEIGRKFLPGLNDRLMRSFGPIAHPHEWTRINSGTWYGTSLLILAIFSPVLAASTALIAIAWGDPTASLVGRRYGRVRLRTGRSLEGTLAFMAVTGVGVTLMLAAYYPALSVPHGLAIAATAAVAGAACELASGLIDDNMLVPLGTAGAVAVVCSLLGIAG